MAGRFRDVARASGPDHFRKDLPLHPSAPRPDEPAREMAVLATRHAFLAAGSRRDRSDYFPNERAFRQWVIVIARRFALEALIRTPALAQCLSQLSHRERRILLWAYNDKLGVDELAGALRVGVKRAHRLRRHAVNALRGVLQRAGFVPDDWTWPV